MSVLSRSKGLYNRVRRVVDVTDIYYLAAEYMDCRSSRGTFVAWDLRILDQLPEGVHACFPVVLTSACEWTVVASLRARTLGNSVHGASLQEVHSEAYLRRMTQYLHDCVHDVWSRLPSLQAAVTSTCGRGFEESTMLEEDENSWTARPWSCRPTTTSISRIRPRTAAARTKAPKPSTHEASPGWTRGTPWTRPFSHRRDWPSPTTRRGASFRPQQATAPFGFRYDGDHEAVRERERQRVRERCIKHYRLTE